MSEINDLKKALLTSRREYARALFELNELQLKVLEDEIKAEESKPAEAEIVTPDGDA